MVATEVLGMFTIALAGVLFCAQNALSDNSRNFGVHFFYLYGFACVLGSPLMLAIALRRGKLSQLRKSWKWVALRGTGGASSWVFMCLSLAFGAPLGDASALCSINVVLAALMGRAFLGEALRGLHMLALLLSAAGATLISKPSFLFGREDMEVPVTGYIMALSSGLASSLTFVASRRAQGTDTMLMTASLMLQEGSATMVLPFLGLVQELPAGLLMESPLKAVASVLFLLLLAIASCSTMSLGAQLCPAAAGSTIFSASLMSLGYALQTLLHNRAPELVTLLGAAMMLLAVAFMALARKLYSEPCSGAEADAEARSSSETPAVAQSEEMDDTRSDASHESSLASFVASEWSGVRLRPAVAAVATSAPAAQSLGFASA